jgi:hypothetical protein
MAVETLKIVLTADNKQAIAGMNETVNSLNKVSSAGAATGGAVTKMGSNFTGLSRVLQDLPYGFNAIANNLTNILPAAGALGLGISALVAGLQFAQLGFGSWTRGLEGVLGTTNLATEVNNGYVKSLAEEKVKLDNLFKVAEDNNQSLEVRNQAVVKLRETTGPYLQDLTDDQIMTGLAKDAHNELTEALKKQSIAQAAIALAAPIQQKILELEIENINNRTKAIEDYKNAGSSTASGGTGGGGYMSKEDNRLGVRVTFLAKQRDIVAAIAVEQAKLNQLQDIAAKNAGLDLKPPPGPGGDTEESKEKKALAEMLKAREAYFAEIERMAAEADMKKDQRRMKEMKGEFDVITQDKTKEKDLTNLKLRMDASTAVNQITAQSIDLKDQENARVELANALTERAMQSLTGLANAMANGASMGEAFGNMFKQIAIDIALAAAKAAIFQGILMALPGGGALKFGEGFFGKLKGLLGFSKGGTVSGPQSGYPVMLHGTEHIVRPDQMKSIIASAAQMGGSGASKVVVEGRIQGQDIWLSQQRTNTFRNLST